MSLADMQRCLFTITDRYRNAKLVANRVGNLAIMDDGVFVGWIDIHDGQVYWEDR